MTVHQTPGDLHPSQPVRTGGEVAVIRAAGGIVHSDGNVFFTNVDQFAEAARALLADGSADPIIEQVRQKLLDRSKAGIAKYGTTLARTDLSGLDWLRHMQEEMLDGAGYAQRLINYAEQGL